MTEKSKKVWKITAWTLGSVIVLLVAVILAINPIAKFAIEQIGPLIAGVDMSVKSIDIQLFKGRLELREMIIGNPKGDSYKSPYAMSIGHVDAEIDLKSITSDKLIIRDVNLRDIDINFDTNLISSNLQDIIKNINRLAAKKEDEKRSSSADSKEKKDQLLQVDVFEMHNVSVDVIIKGVQSEGAGVAITIDPIGPLGVEEGISPFTFALHVMNGIVTGVVKQTGLSIKDFTVDLSNAAVDIGANAAEKGTKELVNSVKSFFKGSPKKAEQKQVK